MALRDRVLSRKLPRWSAIWLDSITRSRIRRCFMGYMASWSHCCPYSAIKHSKVGFLLPLLLSREKLSNSQFLRALGSMSSVVDSLPGAGSAENDAG